MTKKKSEASPETKRQQAYHQRVIDDGGKRLVIVLKKDEAALLAEMADAHGGQKGAIMAGLEALRAPTNLSDKQLLAEIERRMK